MKTRYLALLLPLVAALAGCASVLSQISTWAPLGQTVMDGFAPILAVSNPSLGTEATAIGTLIGDVGSGASAAESAGSGQAGVQKVISEIQATDQQLSTFESGLTSAGVNISKNDQTYVVDGTAAVLAVLEGYVAVEAAKSGGTPTAELRDVQGSCFGFETTNGHGPYHAWTDCDPDNAIDLAINPVSKTVVASKKPPTAANFKRNWNALCRKYGYKQKQLHIDASETLVHVVTFGRR